MFDFVRIGHAKQVRVSFGVNVTFLPGQSYNYPRSTISYISVLIRKKGFMTHVPVV